MHQTAGKEKTWDCQKLILSSCYVRGNISVYLGYFPYATAKDQSHLQEFVRILNTKKNLVWVCANL